MAGKAIFFDRDGTLLIEMGYISHPALAVPYAFAADAIKLAREKGFMVFVVTNQSGVARGWLNETELGAVHGRMIAALAARGAALDGVYYCPHHPEATVKKYRLACECRKPAPGLAGLVTAEHEIDLTRSFVIGDKLSDIGFGKALGAKSCLVRTGFGGESERAASGSELVPDLVADNALEAVRWAITEDEKEG